MIKRAISASLLAVSAFAQTITPPTSTPTVGPANSLYGVNAAATKYEAKGVLATLAGSMSGITDLSMSGALSGGTTITHSGLLNTSGSSSSSLYHQIQNTYSSGTLAHAMLALTVAGQYKGDPLIAFAIPGTFNWTVGVINTSGGGYAFRINRQSESVRTDAAVAMELGSGTGVTFPDLAGTGVRIVTASAVGLLSTTTATFPATASSGDIIYASAANTWSNRTIGSSADILQVSGGFPVWNTMSGDITISSAGVTAIGSNKVTSTMLRQGVARSVVGVTGNATANEADIQGTTDQILRVDNAGTGLAFGSIDLSKSAAVGTSILPIANGGTGAATLAGASIPTGTGANTRVAYWSGANTLTSDANFTWNGTTLVLTGAQTISSTLGVTGNITGSGTIIVGTNTDGFISNNGINSTSFRILRYASNPSCTLVRSDGSAGSASALANGVTIGSLFWSGYDGSTITPGAAIDAVTDAAWSSGSTTATHLEFAITRAATTGRVVRMYLDITGFLKVGNGTAPTYLGDFVQASSGGLQKLAIRNSSNTASAGSVLYAEVAGTSATGDALTTYANGTGGVSISSGLDISASGTNATYVVSYNNSANAVLGTNNLASWNKAAMSLGNATDNPTGDWLSTGLFKFASAAEIDGNLAMGGTGSFGGGAGGVIFVKNASTNPSTNPSGGGVMYATAGAGTWRGSSGTVTSFGPAGPHCGRCGYDFWTVASRNDRFGAYLYICGHCGARYGHGPKSILPLLTREELAEVLHD